MRKVGIVLIAYILLGLPSVIYSDNTNIGIAFQDLPGESGSVIINNHTNETINIEYKSKKGHETFIIQPQSISESIRPTVGFDGFAEINYKSMEDCGYNSYFTTNLGDFCVQKKITIELKPNRLGKIIHLQNTKDINKSGNLWNVIRKDSVDDNLLLYLTGDKEINIEVIAILSDKPHALHYDSFENIAIGNLPMNLSLPARSFIYIITRIGKKTYYSPYYLRDHSMYQFEFDRVDLNTFNKVSINMSTENPGRVDLSGMEGVFSLNLEPYNDKIVVPKSEIVSPVIEYPIPYKHTEFKSYFIKNLPGIDCSYRTLSKNFKYKFDINSVYFPKVNTLFDSTLNVRYKSDGKFSISLGDGFTKDSTIYVWGDGIDEQKVNYFECNDCPYKIFWSYKPRKDSEYYYTLPADKDHRYIVSKLNRIELQSVTMESLVEECILKEIGLEFVLRSKKMLAGFRLCSIDEPPEIINARTTVPVKYLIEPLGGSLKYSDDGILICKLGKNIVEMDIGKPTAKINGKETQIDPNNPKVTPIIINGRTMVPVRFLAESLGCEVKWIAPSKTILITYKP